MGVWWERTGVAGAIVVLALLLARAADRALEGRGRLAPDALTRFRVIRRSVTALIVAFGLMTALLVIPQVRAIAGGILASSAVLSLVVGFAARSTLANFIAGLLIAFSQPVRLGDRVEIGGVRGDVEEIGLSYTTVRTLDGDRLVIPNERLASDTIRNSTIVSAEHLAKIAVPVPLSADLAQLVSLVHEEARGAAGVPPERAPAVSVTELAETGVVLTVEVWTADEPAAERLAAELRLRIHERLRRSGAYHA